MCGCRNRSTGVRTTNNPIAKSAQKACKPLSDYQIIDTSKWTQSEKGILTSQIRAYTTNCSLFEKVIDAIQLRYQ